MNGGTVTGIVVISSFWHKKKTGFWGKSIVPMLNNNVGDFFGKNSNFCEFKEDYTLAFSKQFEKKICSLRPPKHTLLLT